MVEAIVGGVFVSVSALTYIAVSPFFSEERRVQKRLQHLSAYEAEQAAQAEPLLMPLQARVAAPIAEGVRKSVRRLAPKGWREETRHRLVLAGIRGLEPERFIAVRFILLVATAMFWIAVSAVATIPAVMWFLFVLPACVLAYMLPSIWLSGRISSRQHKIRRQLPDMLDMLTISVEAGLGFDGALAKLIQNTTGPLPEEFGRVLQEVQAGIDRSAALRHLSERTEVTELDSFIMAIIQAEVFGISVSKVLRQQAGEMRTRRRQSAEEQAQKAPVRLVFPLILCILPATLIVILGPAIIRIAEAMG